MLVPFKDSINQLTALDYKHNIRRIIETLKKNEQSCSSIRAEADFYSPLDQIGGDMEAEEDEEQEIDDH
jgi:hypothetical protein